MLLALLALLTSRALPGASQEARGQGAGRRPAANRPVDEAGPRSEDPLREAMRDFYVHALRDELAVPGAKAEAFEKAVRDLQRVQADHSRSRAELASELKAAVGPDAMPDAKVASQLAARWQAQELDAARALREARQSVLAQLTPTQGLRFMAFEERFRARGRQLAARPHDDGQPPGPPKPHRERAPGAAPDGPEPPGPPGADFEADVEPMLKPRLREALETVKLALAHDVRTRLGLTNAAMLELYPDLDALVDTRVSQNQQRRQGARSLRRLAWSEDASDAEKAAALRDAIEAETDGLQALTAARRKVLGHLDAVQGARFLLLEDRWEHEIRRRLQELVRQLRPPAEGSVGKWDRDLGPAPLRRPYAPGQPGRP
jgi:hypothetical protein